MSDAQRRLSLLRRDLHHWKDALASLPSPGVPCITANDVIAGVQMILDQDQHRIGSRGGYTSETPIDVTEFGPFRPTRVPTDARPRHTTPPTTDVAWADEP